LLLLAYDEGKKASELDTFVLPLLFLVFFFSRVVAVALLQQFGNVSKVGAGRKGLSSIGLSFVVS
jgi:hypothetical protein